MYQVIRETSSYRAVISSKRGNIYRTSQGLYHQSGFIYGLLWFGAIKFHPRIQGLIHRCCGKHVIFDWHRKLAAYIQSEAVKMVKYTNHKK